MGFKDDEPLQDEVDLVIDGMHCAACVSRVERLLKKIDGIESANVNLALKLAHISISRGKKVTKEKIRLLLQEYGYDLVDVITSTDKDISYELESDTALTKRLIISFLLGVPVFLLSMPEFFPIVLKIPEDIRYYSMFILTTPIQFWCGLPFLVNAYKGMKKLSFDMNSLIALGTLSAFILSTFELIFKDSMFHNSQDMHLYFDSSAMIISFILLGRHLEQNAKRSIFAAVKSLYSLIPDDVISLVDGKEVRKRVNEIRVGDTVVFKPGDRISIDGEVIEGSSLVDESMLTGEPIPVEKAIGSQVFSGTINTNGILVVRATKVGKDSTISQIINIVKSTQTQKVKIQRIVDRISSIFVPIVIVISFVSGIIWFNLGPEPRFYNAFLTFISVLIIACPCAMGLATPIALLISTTKGAQNGILIKDFVALENISHITTCIFDKTGTLTHGQPEVFSIHTSPNIDEKKLLQLAYSLEKNSNHPLSKAIVKLANEWNLAPLSVYDFKEIPGTGINGKIEGKLYTIGRLNQTISSIQIPENLAKISEELTKEGKTVIYLQDDRELLGIISLQDKIKEDAHKVIEALKKHNIKCFIASGDGNLVVSRVAKELGMDGYWAEVSPPAKLSIVKSLQERGEKVMMVGDGINDGPALIQADVGVAMGSGSDLALQSAHIVLALNNLKLIPAALILIQKTKSIINQNLFWAFFYNVVMIPVAAGALYPFFGIRLNPMIASITMALSSISVVVNSMRLKSFKISKGNFL